MNEFFQSEHFDYWRKNCKNYRSWVARIRYRAHSAFQHVLDIGAGRSTWKMSSPTQSNDSDLVINSALKDTDRLTELMLKLIEVVDAYADGLEDHGDFARKTLNDVEFHN